MKLKSLLVFNKEMKIKDCIVKFQENQKMVVIKTKFLSKMLNNRSNKYQTSFHNWKNLPYQKAKLMK